MQVGAVSFESQQSPIAFNRSVYSQLIVVTPQGFSHLFAFAVGQSFNQAFGPDKAHCSVKHVVTANQSSLLSIYILLYLPPSVFWFPQGDLCPALA